MDQIKQGEEDAVGNYIYFGDYGGGDNNNYDDRHRHIS